MFGAKRSRNLGFGVCFKLCMAFMILLFLTPEICRGHDHKHDHEHQKASFKYSREANENLNLHNDVRHQHDHLRNKDISSIWMYSILSTLIISAAPFILLFIIPLDNSDLMRPRLKVLLAFASGGLLGDAFLHLIPHATNPHHSHDHSHHEEDAVHHNEETDHHHHNHDISVGLWVLCGIIVFLTVEKIVRLLKGGKGHSHSHESKSNVENSKKEEKNKKSPKTKQDVEVTAYLNLAADFAHNFTDGLAIGASYLAGNSIGIVTTVTILLHEVPHEIGDFAILIKSGCDRRKAIMLQLVTAVGALCGTVLALIGVGDNTDTIPWVLPFTAGGFIYIATVSVLPELLEETTKLGQSIKEIGALLTGVLLMVFIAYFE